MKIEKISLSELEQKQMEIEPDHESEMLSSSFVSADDDSSSFSSDYPSSNISDSSSSPDRKLKRKRKGFSKSVPTVHKPSATQPRRKRRRKNEENLNIFE